MKKVDHNC